MTSPTVSLSRSHLLAAAILTLAAFALYGTTAAPGLLWADSAELQAAAMSLGIPHATGYPSFVLLGALAGKLGGLHAVNLVSSASGALALGFLVLVLGELGVGITASVAGAIVFGLTFAPWRSALRAEVYTLAIAFAAAGAWATLVAHRTGSWRMRLVAAVLLGLTLTGHLSFALPVAVLGLTLAWRTWRDGRAPVLRLALLLLSFLLGLTPWLQTWIADVRGSAIDYFRLVHMVHAPHGEVLRGLETPLRRVVWLILGRNEYPPPPPPSFALKHLVISAVDIAFTLFYFQLGPIALGFAIAGCVRLWRTARSRAGVLFASLFVALLFCLLFSIGGPMTALFLLPAMLPLVVAIGAGIEAAIDRLALREAPAVAVAALIVLAIVAPGNLLREYADAHPLTRWKFRMTEEGNDVDRAWVPSLRNDTGAERYGRRAMQWLPPNSVVFSNWADLNVLLYFHSVRRERPDLVIQPIAWGTLAERMRVWQRSHDVAASPFVFTDVPPDSFRVAIAESLEVVPGHSLYVSRTPIPEAR